MRRNLPIVLFITFLDTLSLSVFFGTIIPLVLAQQSLFPLTLSTHSKSVVYGLLLLILPLGQFLITPLWGQLADQVGRKKILTGTLLGSALGYLLLGVAIHWQCFWLFLLGRIITACVAVNIAISLASVADYSSGPKKTQRFNLQFVCFSLGFIVGPYLISYTTQSIHYANVYWVLAGGYTVALLILSLLFVETLPNMNRTKVVWLINLRQIFAIFTQKKLTQIFIIWLVFQLGWSLFFQYSGEFLYLKHNVTNDFINHLFSWVGVGALITQLVLVQPLAHKLQPQTIIPWALLLVGSSLLVMGFLPLHMSFYVFLGIYCIGIGFFLTNMNAYVSNLATADEQGRTMTLLTSSQSAMDLVVTLLGSFFVAYYLPAPYVIGGGIILLSLIVWLLRRS